MRDISFRIPKTLIDVLKDKDYGLFIGAGLSVRAGYPSWETLLSELIDKISEETSTPMATIDELRHLAKKPSKYLLVAETIKEILPSDIYRYIKQRFGSNDKDPTSVHKKLFDIKSRFVVTTNYDTLIENAYVKKFNKMPTVYTYKDASSINYNLYDKVDFILKAHGDSNRAPNEIILTEKDYRNIIYNEKGYQSVLQNIFSSFNIIFIGVSLNDPELNLLLGYIHHIFHGGTPEHYALMAVEKTTKTEIDRWKKDFNINVITYNPEGNHKQIDCFIDELIKYS